MPIHAVFFDVGETLVDETRQWMSWADWLGVPRLTFCAAFGAVIERDEHHRRVFDVFVPGFDFAKASQARADAGKGFKIETRDFYPDALPALARLKSEGLVVGIAGNQPEDAETALAACGVTADHVASSARWGVEKPSAAFFDRIVNLTGLHASEIAHVGDRLDNDILPAKNAGMQAIFLVRGPWGFIHARRAETAEASAVIHGLEGLPELLNGMS